MNDHELEQKIIEYRRALHRIPELDFDLPKTRAFLTEVLKPLGCELKDLGKPGFVAYFNNHKEKTLAFRSDMDAIPIDEPEGSEFRSIHKGAMHACGHDGHMAMLLGLAEWLSVNSEKINVNVLLVFQAAEETTGGAQMICDTGIFDEYKPSKIYGIHLWPQVPKGQINCRPGGFMAGTYVVTIDIEGRAAHIAEYAKGIDALEAGCMLVNKAYEFEASLPKDIFRLLRFGEFNSGTANNVIAEKTRITGAIRAYDDETFVALEKGILDAAGEAELKTGASIGMHKSEGYPPVVNPQDLYNETKEKLSSAGFVWNELTEPLLLAEDFSHYQRILPGLYMHLGTGVDTKLHNPDYTLDESVLLTGVNIFRALL